MVQKLALKCVKGQYFKTIFRSFSYRKLAEYYKSYEIIVRGRDVVL